MNKVQIKKDSGLMSDFHLYDTHRHVPGSEGGDYSKENVEVLSPVEHMKKHGNYRKREELFEELKSVMDDRKQVMKSKQKIENQLGAYERGTDSPNPDTVDFLKNLINTIEPRKRELDKKVKNIIKEYAKYDQLTKSALDLHAVGEVTIAYMLIYVDVKEAKHASSLWAYVGVDKPSYQRYQKGVKGGGNKTLRSILYTLAESQIKQNGPYRYIYDNKKERLAHSEDVTWTVINKKRVEAKWKDTQPSHRHGAAIRDVMKHFLADYWYVARTLRGLDTSPLYPEAMLGGNHRTIMPEERGWKY